MPREECDEPDGVLHRRQQHPPHDAEVRAELRAHQRRQGEQGDDDRHAVAFEPRVAQRGPAGQETEYHPAAVQGREGQQVEDGQHHVQHQRVLQVRKEPCRGWSRERVEDVKAEGGGIGHREVDAGASGGHQDHVAPRLAQTGEVDRHRLGVAEQERRAQEEQQPRQHDRAEGVDVAQGVEAHPPHPPRRIVPELRRRPAVRRLVQGDRSEHRQHPDGGGIEQRRHVTGHVHVPTSISRSSSTGSISLLAEMEGLSGTTCLRLPLVSRRIGV